MEDGVTTCYVKVGLPSERITEVVDVGERLQHALKAHAVERLCVVLAENVAVLAALVTVVEQVPLEREVRT